jgi:tetratricopeptide (TPR) repeat protein
LGSAALCNKVWRLLQWWPAGRADRPFVSRLEAALVVVRQLQEQKQPDRYFVQAAIDAVLTISLPFDHSELSRPDAVRAFELYRTFAIANESLWNHARLEGAFRHLMTNTLPELIERSGQGRSAVDAMFLEMAHRWPSSQAAPLARAQHEVELAQESLRNRRSWPRRVVLAETSRARALLRDVADRDRGPEGRNALAALANLELSLRRLPEAGALFESFEKRYPDSEWAWVAAMRAAQVTQALGNPLDAAERFRSIGSVYADEPTVPALAAFYEARAYEMARRWNEATGAYVHVLQMWPISEAEWLGLDWPIEYENDASVRTMWPRELHRWDVTARIEQLTVAASTDWGLEVERANWLFERQRPAEALLLLRRIRARHSGRTVRDRLRPLIHRAALAEAVASISRSGRLPELANRSLAALCVEPLDAWAAIACATHASAAAVDGRAGSAKAELVRAIDMWARLQASAAAAQTPPTPVEQDVRAIHDLLFKASSKANVILMLASLSVTIGDDPQPVVVTAPRPAGTSQILSVTADEAKTLWDAVNALSACAESRERRLTRLWTEVVGITPSYCSGGFGSSDDGSVLQSIHFANVERTRARALVSSGSGGHAPILEKIDGQWKVTGSAGAWMY